MAARGGHTYLATAPLLQGVPRELKTRLKIHERSLSPGLPRFPLVLFVAGIPATFAVFQLRFAKIPGSGGTEVRRGCPPRIASGNRTCGFSRFRLRGFSGVARYRIRIIRW